MTKDKTSSSEDKPQPKAVDDAKPLGASEPLVVPKRPEPSRKPLIDIPMHRGDEREIRGGDQGSPLTKD